jgi:hypothetical protein
MIVEEEAITLYIIAEESLLSHVALKLLRQS